MAKDDIVLAVNGQDVTRLTHQQVTDLIRHTKTRGVWLSVCEGDSNSSIRSSTSKSNLQNSYSPSTPILNRSGGYSSPALDIPQKRTPDIMMQRRSLGSARGQQYATNGALDASPTKAISTSASSFSPFARKAMMQQSDSEYVALVPPPPVYTRLAVLLHYVGPVKIPDSWSVRGVSSRCIQECARQLLSKRQSKDFLKVQLEVSQTSMKITNIQSNILVKHRRNELFYCGLCTNDEQYFAIVTKATATPGGSAPSPTADLCHIFKLLPDSKLSTYCIDRKKSNREMKSGPEASVKSCSSIIEAVQTIFQSEEQWKSHKRIEHSSSSDTVEYGVVKGVSTYLLQSGENGGGSNEPVGGYSTYSSSPTQSLPSSAYSSPSGKRKLDVIDLRPQGKQSPPRRHQRSGSNPPFPVPPGERVEFPTSSLVHHSSVGGSANGFHVRMGSDGSSSSSHSSSLRNKPQQVPVKRKSFQHDNAQRVSDSSLSSYSSDHSGQHSGSCSPTPAKSPSNTGHRSTSPVPSRPVMIPDVSPHRIRRTRRPSYGMRPRATSPTYETAMMSSRGQLRRQVRKQEVERERGRRREERRDGVRGRGEGERERSSTCSYCHVFAMHKFC